MGTTKAKARTRVRASESLMRRKPGSAPMSAKAKKAPPRVLGNPQAEGSLLLILDRLMPILDLSMRFGAERYKNDKTLAVFMDGAIYATAAFFARESGQHVTPDDIAKLYAGICEIINNPRFPDLDGLAQNFLARVGASA